LGFLGVIQIVFIVLKITNNIEWSWLEVFSPTFMYLGLVVL